MVSFCFSSSFYFFFFLSLYLPFPVFFLSAFDTLSLYSLLLVSNSATSSYPLCPFSIYIPFLLSFLFFNFILPFPASCLPPPPSYCIIFSYPFLSNLPLVLLHVAFISCSRVQSCCVHNHSVVHYIYCLLICLSDQSLSVKCMQNSSKCK